MVVQDIGYGAGDKEFAIANVLRIQLGDVVTEEAEPMLTRISQSELAYVMETNIDDMSPEPDMSQPVCWNSARWTRGSRRLP